MGCTINYMHYMQKKICIKYGVTHTIYIIMKYEQDA